MTVAQNIAFPLEQECCHSAADITTRVTDALEKVRLPGIERVVKRIAGVLWIKLVRRKAGTEGSGRKQMRSYTAAITLVSLGLGCIKSSVPPAREVDAGTDAAVAGFSAIRDIQLAGNRRGDAVLVVHVVAADKDALWASRFDPDGGTWSTKVTLAAYDRPPDAGLVALGATVSLDPLGNAVALWSPPDAGADHLSSAVNEWTTSWSAQPILPSGHTTLAGGRSVSALSEGAGQFTAAYLRAADGGALLRASRYRSNTGWALASEILVPFDGGTARELSGGADSTGAIHFAISAGGSIFGARLDPDGGWGPVVFLGQSTASYYASYYAGESQISVNAGGTAVAAWGSRDMESIPSDGGTSDGGAGDAGVSYASVNSIWLSWYQPDAGWTAAEKALFPVDYGGRPGFRRVAIDDSARAVILAEGVYRYSAVRSSGPGNFGSVAEVTTTTDVYPGRFCSLGLDPVGDGYLVCEGFTHGVYEAGVYAKRFIGSNGSWTNGGDVSGGGDGGELFEAFSNYPFAPRITLDEAGRALLLFIGYAVIADAGAATLYSARSTGASTWSTAERRF